MGGVVRHRCDRAPCCNPAHLEEGTHADNTQDALLRGQFPLGERHGQSKLKRAEVLEIRRAVRGGLSQKSQAEKYDRHVMTISDIVRRKTWAHVPEEV
jgi:hypothetical protein